MSPDEKRHDDDGDDRRKGAARSRGRGGAPRREWKPRGEGRDDRRGPRRDGRSPRRDDRREDIPQTEA
ncbi:MAG: hypothetical protein ACO3V5_09335, partial [Ilumatobacteraceae bacterium]